MLVVGVDEAGRGPLAGPVVAAAVILGDAKIAGLADSKALTPAARERLAETIRARCRHALGEASVAEIAELNIVHATMLAMTRAVAALGLERHEGVEVRVDGNRLPAWDWRAVAIVGGDRLDPAIGAASILAKVTRDALMVTADAAHPGYGFARHKGYGVPEHLAALERLGPCALHRRGFAPVRRAAALFDRR